MGQAGQFGGDAFHHLAAVDLATGMDIAVLGDQHLGVDLAEPVDDRGMAHIGRTERPDGAQPDRRQEGDQRILGVGQDGDDPVAAFHAHGAQGRLDRADAVAQLRPGQFLAAEGFRLQHQRGGVGLVLGVAQDLRGHVGGGAGEPVGAGHLAFRQHLGPTGDGEVAEFDDRGPEPFKVTDRPFPHVLVIGELQTAIVPEPALVLRQSAGLGALRAGGPEYGAVFGVCHSVLLSTPSKNAARAAVSVRGKIPATY